MLSGETDIQDQRAISHSNYLAGRQVKPVAKKMAYKNKYLNIYRDEINHKSRTAAHCVL